ncbi:hypothetical protein G3I33_25835 [Streptomyces sp. SID9124]|nr:hypothetical protein [Streptomyces sp. SID9124]
MPRPGAFCEHARMPHVLDPLVIRHTHRLPAPSGPAGQGGVAARQFDSALMSVGFKLSGPVLEHLSALSGETVTETARRTLEVVREMVGDHVRHNTYFTEAPDGASEFINLRLGAVRGDFIVPQVSIYSGEGVDAVAESFFGFMTRDAEQAGRPFEPRTVRMKSELRGRGAVALPLAFLRGDDGRWRAKWLHLYLRGAPNANRVEGNRVSVAALTRGIVERDHLTVGYLTGLMEGRGATAELWDGASVPDGPVTYIGLERPDGLHPDSVVVTPGNLRDLIPA